MAAAIRRTVQLYYDVVSPQAWITFEELFRYADPWKVDVVLKPFSLAGVQVRNSQGSTEDGQDHIRVEDLIKDAELLGKHYDVPIRAPTNAYYKMYTRGTLTAMRLLTATNQTSPDLTRKLSHSLWVRMWSKDKDITERASLIEVGKDVGMSDGEMEGLLRKTKEKCTTIKLRSVTNEALLLGVFSAPTIIVEDTENTVQVLSGVDRMNVLALLLDQKYDPPTSLN